MKNKLFSITGIVLLSLGIVSCKKSVSPLEAEPDNEIVKKECTLNGISTIGVNFVNKKYDKDIDMLYVYFTNLSTDPIDSASVLIELCEYPESYDNCKSLFPVKIGSVKPQDTIGYQFLFKSGHFHLADKTINVGITKLNGQGNQFAGNYKSNNNSFYSTSNYMYGFESRAYIFADGAAVFRMKLPYSDSTLYNITGNIYTVPLSFSGVLSYKYKSLSTKLFMDTTQKTALKNDTLTCMLNLVNPIGDSLKSFNFNLLNK